ncbi:MAG: ABC transporter permease subunit [Verrucomicrobiae bacterium]|nr:ABC transporter permease subunit [Verrucomicrobiae bacterium]
MGLISNMDRKRGKGLAIILFFYLSLILGGVTMVVPFLMSLSTSVTNQYDSTQYNVIPKFLYNEDSLFFKYLFLKYTASNADYDRIKNLYQINNAEIYTDFAVARNPMRNNLAPLEYHRWNPEKLRRARQDWEDYWSKIRQLPPTKPLGVVVLYPTINRSKFQDFLRNKYLALWREKNPDEARNLSAARQEIGALALMNSTYARTVATMFSRVSLSRGDLEYGRNAVLVSTPQTEDYESFLRTLEADQVTLVGESGDFQTSLRDTHISLEKLNQAWGTGYRHWDEIDFIFELPAHRERQKDWLNYVHKKMPMTIVTVEDPLPTPEFRAWLLKKFQGNLAALNASLRTDYKTPGDIVFTASLPQNKLLRGYWSQFVADRVPLSQWKLKSPIPTYRTFLAERYGTIEKLNEAYGQSYRSFSDFRLPQAAFDRQEFLSRKLSLVWFFLTNNFVQVFKFIATQGNAMWNTLILIVANLVAGLTVNPLAAFALSRYKIKFKQMVLILFLIPMAFPGEVMQIPGFILTRDLGLLNTYWALILPGLANGFGIFMMKGFFDGLPRELYEAAEIDGANEWQIYWNVTFPMCKPIIALTMLNTVIASYSEYFWAFIVCPDERKWTLAVWIFQFSMDAMERGETHLQMAGLVLMTLPTLLLFVYMQRIIMKGIILPSMK